MNLPETKKWTSLKSQVEPWADDVHAWIKGERESE